MARSTEPNPKSSAGDWSVVINGLSGRLLVQFEDLNPGLRHTVSLELRNHALKPVAVTNQPKIHAEIFDPVAKPVSTAGFVMDGPMPLPQWAVIPQDAYIGFRIDMQTVGVPTREHGVALIAVGGKTWELRAGRHVLHIAVAFKNDASGPSNQWVGELKLPSVEVVVTPQMLAMS